MFFPPILAHGTLGALDELIFVSVIVIFLVMMVLSWLRSRGIEPEEDTLLQMVKKESQDEREDHFELD